MGTSSSEDFISVSKTRLRPAAASPLASSGLNESNVPVAGKPKRAALRRLRVDVAVVGKAGRIFEFADRGDPVPPFRRLLLRSRPRGQRRYRRRKHERTENSGSANLRQALLVDRPIVCRKD